VRGCGDGWSGLLGLEWREVGDGWSSGGVAGMAGVVC
jgi:hypothetical protein